MKYQSGYINMDLDALFWMAGIGAIATIIGVPFGLYWLFTHFTIVAL